MVETERQIVELYKGGEGFGKLYLSCHPTIYGHDAAWRKADMIIDVDNGWDVWPSVISEGAMYVRWVIEDGDLPDVKDLFRMAQIGAEHIRSGRNVLVHCWAGVNRSALMAATILHILTAEDGEKIYQHIRRKKTMTFTNETFKSFVRSNFYTASMSYR